MAFQWYVCPLVVASHPDGGVIRTPKVALLVDPSKVPISGIDAEGNATLLGKGYSMSAVFGPGPQTHCLCLVWSADFSTIDRDPDCVPVFSNLVYTDRDSPLMKSGRETGQTIADVARLQALAPAATRAEVTLDAPLAQVLRAVGRRYDPAFAGPEHIGGK